MNLADLLRNAGVLPISETGLASIVADLDENRDLDPEAFIDAARYSIRAIGALMPPEKFDILTIAQVAGVDPVVKVSDLLEVLEARGDYIGETPVAVLRSFIGLVDDGVRPFLAARHFSIPEDEFELLTEFLDLENHWASRILDKVHVILLDGGTWRQVALELAVGPLTAWRIARWGRRSLQAMGLA